MRCYSHLSGDEREQIGLGKALGRSIGAIAQTIGCSKSTVWPDLSRKQVADWDRRLTPPEPIAQAACADRKRPSVTDSLLSTGSPKGGPASKLGWLKGGNEPGLRPLGRETTPSSTGPRNRPGSYGVISRAGTNAAARADRDLGKIPSRIASPSTNGPRRRRQNRWRPLGVDLIISKRTRPVLVLHERKSRVAQVARLAGKTDAKTISIMLAVLSN
jgi:IS30 family transposase